MFKIYQIQCRVKDLKATVKDFEDLGFEVEWGGRPDRAYNVWIKFNKGPMIEIFRMPGIAYYLSYIRGFFYGKGSCKRWQRWCRSEGGICDFTLKGTEKKLSDINEFNGICKWLDKIGIKSCPIVKGRRKDINGRLIEYKYCMPQISDFPIFLSDYQIPVSDNIIGTHKNGSEEISQIIIGVPREHKEKLTLLLSQDTRVKIVENEVTKILGIHIKGLKNVKSTAKLHGIRIV